ncbi:MBL fold metallo-hydrolase [Pedobacter immunditicola]|uniref:MBL fold metallo-hydrolase n=1 Tax=Pedobacter immunditicola TaxID=3133440 RepID=UPI0030ABD6F7
MMRITFVGTGDAFGSGGRMNTCFHVETATFNFLIDCGAGTLSGLKKFKLVPNSIVVIFISHFHGDHYGGLPFFLLDAAINERKEPLTIIGPAGCRDKVVQLLDLLYPGTEVLEKLQVEFIAFVPDRAFVHEHYTLLALPVIHTAASLPHGLRIETAGRVISYSGDTEWTDNLFRLAEDADLFICECNFFSMQVKGHLSFQVLQEKLPELRSKRMILTHLGNEMLENLHKVDLSCAHDGKVLEL